MKNLKIWSLAIALLVAMVGCGTETEEGPKKPRPCPVSEISTKIVAEWQLVNYDDVKGHYDVYIAFTEEGTFTLYQRWAAEYVSFKGTYEVNGDMLTGVYADGGSWKNDYKVEVAFDASELRLYSEEDRSITSVYVNTTIPAYVKEEKPEDDNNNQGGNDNTGTEGGDDNTGTEGGNDNTGTEGGDDNTGTEGGNDNTGTEGGDDNTGTEDTTPEAEALSAVVRFL